MSSQQQQYYERRNSKMEAMFSDGRTMQEIGLHLGLSRQRVHQVLAERGFDTSEGGAKVAWAQRRADIDAERERACHERHGCSREELRAIKPSARLAFRKQREHVQRKGIVFALKLGEWWMLWQQSGHWKQRGRARNKYVMTRRADGPLSAANALICKLSEAAA